MKETVGISQDRELVKTLQILAEKVHPLALGNVDRFLSQSRMIARKILNTHMVGVSEHDIDEIIENMASKLYFHGHPINRKEARQELRLKVLEKPPLELEGLMWDLFKDYEAEFESQSVFNPYGDLVASPPAGGKAGAPQKEYEHPLVLIESGRLSSRQQIKKRFTLHQLQPGQPMLQEETLGLSWTHSAAP